MSWLSGASFTVLPAAQSGEDKTIHEWRLLLIGSWVVWGGGRSRVSVSVCVWKMCLHYFCRVQDGTDLGPLFARFHSAKDKRYTTFMISKRRSALLSWLFSCFCMHQYDLCLDMFAPVELQLSVLGLIMLFYTTDICCYASEQRRQCSKLKKYLDLFFLIMALYFCVMR